MHRYLLGLPCTDLEAKDISIADRMAPLACVSRCFEIFRDFYPDYKRIQEQLRLEYMAIAESLASMGLEFRIMYDDSIPFDKELVMACHMVFGCRLTMARGYWSGGVLYPRDLFMMINEKLVVVNSEVTSLTKTQVGDCMLIESPLGQGGRILACEDLVFAPERLHEEGKTTPRETSFEDLRSLRSAGLRVVKFPQPVGIIYNAEEITGRVFTNDHLDRYACLLRGTDGKIHMLTDINTSVASWTNRITGEWAPDLPDQAIRRLREICGSEGVVLHALESSVPYVYNMLQLPDGRVLMTSGDAKVQKAVEAIVGQDKVFVTRIPIIAYPVFSNAGIRCLVTEQPPIVVPRQPGS